MTVPCSYSGETIKTISTDQRIFSFSFSMKTGCGQFTIFSICKIRVVKIVFGETSVAKIFVGEVSVGKILVGESPLVKFTIREISFVEWDVSDAETSHSRSADAEFVPELFIAEAKRAIVKLRWAFV